MELLAQKYLRGLNTRAHIKMDMRLAVKLNKMKFAHACLSNDVAH